MWKLPSLEVKNTSGATDTDVVAVFQDAGKKAIPPRGTYAALVEKLRKGQAFVARHGSATFVRFGGKGSAENVLFAGMGLADELTEEKARSAGGSVWQKLCAEKVSTAAVYIDSMGDEKLVRAFAEGLVFGAYQFTKRKGKSGPAKGDYLSPDKITLVTQDKSLKKSLDDEVKRILAAAEAMNHCRDWSNEPSNVGTPEFFAAEARKIAKEHGLKFKVLSEADAAREKMNLFLGVGQGSEREGKIVVLEYTPKGVKNPKTIAFVGKGVTFDSGGISIKPSARMEEMKHDMTGAATVLGATVLAAEWKVPNRIVAIMAFTENMPSGSAIQPGNIIAARNGKTVEVNNTDAEGRLILADVLDYAHDFKPDAIVDVATLTGAVSVALGRYCCGILGNDDTLIQQIQRAGDANGERLWQLPLWDEYFDDMKTEHADMKNVGNDGAGGTIRGAIFLKQFIRKGMRWAHLDIAATAWGIGFLSYMPKKGASGLHVRTLAQFAADF